MSMKVEIKQLHKIDGWDPSKVKLAFVDAHQVIHMLSVHLIFGSPGTILSKPGARLDRQSPLPGGGANLQVQLNGYSGKTTIAAILVPRDPFYQLKDKNPGLLEKRVKKALFESLRSGYFYTLVAEQG